MTNLNRAIKRTSKSSANISGTIVDIFGDNASVKLSSNGALMRSLKVIGGPVAVGQVVEVSFQQSPPVVIAYAPAGMSQQDTNRMVNTARTPFITRSTIPPTIDIYHNTVFVATVEGINFVDGA